MPLGLDRNISVNSNTEYDHFKIEEQSKPNNEEKMLFEEGERRKNPKEGFKFTKNVGNKSNLILTSGLSNYISTGQDKVENDEFN